MANPKSPNTSNTFVSIFVDSSWRRVESDNRNAVEWCNYPDKLSSVLSIHVETEQLAQLKDIMNQSLNTNRTLWFTIMDI